MIEDGIARFGVTQKIDKRDVIGLRTGKIAYDEIEIRRRKPRPTIRPDHREPIISTGDAKRQGASTVVPFEQWFNSPAVPPSLVFENAESSSVRQKEDEKKKALEPRGSKPVRESISAQEDGTDCKMTRSFESLVCLRILLRFA
jgi:hypothetical protein